MVAVDGVLKTLKLGSCNRKKYHANAYTYLPALAIDRNTLLSHLFRLAKIRICAALLSLLHLISRSLTS